MKILTAVLLLLLASQSAKSVEFMNQINRLQAPVMVKDVLSTDDEQLGDMAWPQAMKGWVSKDQVEQWLSTKAAKDAPVKMEGFKRVWVEWCHPVNLDGAIADAESQIKSLVGENIHVMRIETAQSGKRACFEQEAIQHDWLSIEKVKGTRFAGKLQFLFEQGRSVEKTFFFDVDAKAEAMTLKSKGRRQQLVSQLNIKSKTVVWSGDELVSLDALGGYQLKKTLPRNTVLKQKHFDVMEDVPKGQSVKVKVSYGAIEIDTVGTAITAGNVGQKIKIRVDGSNEMSEGQIIKKGVVHVSV